MNSKLVLLFLIAFNLQLILGQKLNKKKDCKCKTPALKKIIGGKTSLPHFYPHHVSFSVLNSHGELKFEGHQCGGTILNKKMIMTSFECAMLAANSKIRAGVHDLNNSTEGKVYTFKKIFLDSRYHRFNPDGIGNFALIEINEVIEFNQHIQPACLTKNHDWEIQKLNLTVAGWDATQYLEEVEIYQNSDSFCPDYALCWDSFFGKQPTKRDFGGAMMIIKDGITKVVGVMYAKPFYTSGGNATKVSFYLPKLEEWGIGDDYCLRD